VVPLKVTKREKANEQSINRAKQKQPALRAVSAKPSKRRPTRVCELRGRSSSSTSTSDEQATIAGMFDTDTDSTDSDFAFVNQLPPARAAHTRGQVEQDQNQQQEDEIDLAFPFVLLSASPPSADEGWEHVEGHDDEAAAAAPAASGGGGGGGGGGGDDGFDHDSDLDRQEVFLPRVIPQDINAPSSLTLPTSSSSSSSSLANPAPPLSPVEAAPSVRHPLRAMQLHGRAPHAWVDGDSDWSTACVEFV
jgi:hypothetical protein